MIIKSSTARRPFLTSFVSLSCASLILLVGPSTRAQNRAELRAPSSFSSIPDTPTRSRALFSEAAKVIMNPRCMNCHPASDRPTQGNDMHPHSPPVTRGADGGNTCRGCHTLLTDENVQSIPGNDRWGLAPIEMAWQGKSMGEICRQIKDPQRNGGRNLELLYEHLAKDDLVAWGWNPGPGRDPVPGTQERLGELIRAWIDSGAACP
jgi:hypothetical protein